MSEGRRRSPYVGLVPYSEEDWKFFFGRETETELIIANLAASRLTLLFGASGVGKSSVLRAGVAHRLNEQARENRANRTAGGRPELALAIFSAWRDDPLGGLVAAVRDAVAAAAGRDPGPLPARTGIAETFAEWAALVDGDLFVILDQFEEYFLYHGHEEREGTFAVEFPRLVRREGLRVNFLLAMREDAVARLDRFKGRIPNLLDNYLRLHHLGLEAAEDAVRKPLERFNALYPQEAMTIEDALVAEVLEQTRADGLRKGRGAAEGIEGTEMAGARIETPYLQMVMTRLWDEELAESSNRLRLATFTEKLGGARQIVRTHLDLEMERLEPSDRDLAAEAFRYLVTRTGAKIALAVEDLAGYTGLPAATLAPVLDRLAAGGRRILRPVPVPDHPQSIRYEIFHDVLGPAITDWRRRHLARKEQEAIRSAEEKRRLDELREAEERRERERSWFLKLGLAVLSVGFVILLAVAWVAWQERNDAREAEARAREALAQAERAREESELARRRAEEESRKAQLAIYDPALAAREAEAKAQAGIEQRAAATARPGVSGADRGTELREAFLTKGVQAIEDTAGRLGLLNDTVQFRARRVRQDYGVPQGQVYEFSLWPVPDTVPGGLESLSAVTYKMEHETFRNKLLTGDPARGFRAGYFGWGSLSWVPVLLEYKDAGRPPQVALFAMTRNLEAQERGSAR